MQMRDSGLCSVEIFIWLVIYSFLVAQDLSGGKRIQGMVRMLWVNIRIGIVALSDGVWLSIINQFYWGVCCKLRDVVMDVELKLYTVGSSGHKHPMRNSAVTCGPAADRDSWRGSECDDRHSSSQLASLVD